MPFVWLLFLVVAGIAPHAPAQDLLPELIRRIKPSAVAIETFDARGEKLSRGSGFFIDIDRVVTNRHVIEGAFRAEVHSSTGNSYPLEQYNILQNLDQDWAERLNGLINP